MAGGCTGVPSPGTPPVHPVQHRQQLTCRTAYRKYPPRHGAGTHCPRTPSSVSWYSSVVRTRLGLRPRLVLTSSRVLTKGNALIWPIGPYLIDESRRVGSPSISSRSTKVTRVRGQAGRGRGLPDLGLDMPRPRSGTLTSATAYLGLDQCTEIDLGLGMPRPRSVLC